MTKAYSTLMDNNGLCECCNGNAVQSLVPVRLGGGLGMGTMWMCDPCRKEHEKKYPDLKNTRTSSPITLLRGPK